MKRLIFAITVLSISACARSDEKANLAAREEAPMAAPEPEAAAPGAPPAMMDADDAPRRAGRARAKVAKKAALGLLATEGGGSGQFAALAAIDGASGDLEMEKEKEPEAAAATRAWFPETFLFEPLVITDDAGFAKVPVRVPDRLTTWRVLALAHSRDGAQAGAETSFLGTLPTYVDPVVPAFLISGDEVSMPVQVVNTTGEEVTRTLRVDATGVAVSRGAGPVKIPAFGSRVEYVPLRANRPGQVVIKATLGDKDAIEKSFTVLPSGKPMIETRGGALAAPRELEIAVPANADPDSTTARLQVFPGALAILRAELGAASARGGAAGDAYALLLAGRGEALLKSLGGEADPKALRALAIVAGQRVIRAARSPDVPTAALFAEAALVHPDNPVLSRLGERLADTVARGQRPDGTFEGASGWTLQRLLATTAECLRAVRVQTDTPRARQRSVRATLAAEGAFERNFERIEDAYTAAAILASGAVKGTLAERLAKKVREKIRSNADGSKSLPVEAGVVRGDGTTPSEVEATALAVLGLLEANDPEAKKIIPDLGASLLAAYTPGWGFGDGRTSLAALRAVLVLFKDPLPSRVTVNLELDGRKIADRVLEGAKLKETAAIELPVPPGTHRYRVSADPPVPGLGFSLVVKSYVPWEKEEAAQGLELSIETPPEARVGRAVEVSIAASAPAGIELELDIALPAGVEPDLPSLDQLRVQGAIRSFEKSDGHVVLKVPARQPGETFTAKMRVVPTLAGTLRSGASSISGASAEYFVPPSKWVVK